MNKLIDPHGRHIHKLRLALLDACNFRCIYCMPQNPKFMPNDRLLKRDEIFQIASTLVRFGIDEIRLTGGEPTLRSDFLNIVQDLTHLSLSKLGLTTNGLSICDLLPELAQTKLKNINFSLDSLNKTGFEKITGSVHFDKVLHSIFKAQELGFYIKLNVVLMKGINDHELNDFIKFSSRNNIEVRFLELMRIGEARDHFEKHFISASEVMSILQNDSHLTPVELPIDSTSFNYILDNGAQIGFIASESKPFCGGCSRLRLSADGQLRPCLMKNEGISLKNKTQEEMLEILLKTMALKPIERIYEVSQSMNQIGG